MRREGPVQPFHAGLSNTPGETVLVSFLAFVEMLSLLVFVLVATVAAPVPVPLLWQSSHLQMSLHLIPAWKHSQYFFKQ